MLTWYKLAYIDDKEYLSAKNEIYTYRAGSMLAAFLSVDWSGLYTSCRRLLEQPEYLDIRPWLTEMRQKISVENYPALDTFLREQLLGSVKLPSSMAEKAAPLINALRLGKVLPPLPDTVSRHCLGEIAERVRRIAEVQSRLTPLVDAVYDCPEIMEKIPAINRYCAMRQAYGSYTLLADELYALLGTETLCMTSDAIICSNYDDISEEVTENHVKRAKERKKVIAAIARTTNNLEALALYELDYMATHGLVLRRCTFCKRYFAPYSKTACYCKRELGGGRTCQNLGVLATRQKKVDSDAALALRNRVNNRLQMWVRRNMDTCPQAKINYANWKRDAEDLLEQVRAGKMTYAEFADEVNVESAALRQQKNSPNLR